MNNWPRIRRGGKNARYGDVVVTTIKSSYSAMSEKVLQMRIIQLTGI